MSSPKKLVAEYHYSPPPEAPFSEMPHILLDSQGNLASQFLAHQVAERPLLELKNSSGEKIGSVRVGEKDMEAFQRLVSDINSRLVRIRMRHELSRERLIEQDLDRILEQSISASKDFDSLLLELCNCLRTHLLAENCSIFGVVDGHSLSGLAAVTPHGSKTKKDDWNYSSMNVASLVIREKKPYVSENADKDGNFVASPLGAPRSLACFPILHRGETIGVLNLANKLIGGFEEKDLVIIQRFSAVLSTILRTEFDAARSEKIETVAENLGKYLSKNIVTKIDATGTSGDLGGIMKKVVVLFSDIRSFTSISEGLKPSELVKLLNIYFEEMGQVVERHHGTIDKLVGDLMMVLWNIPADQADPEVLAVKAAIEMQKTFKRKVLPKWLEHGVPNFGIGIGINSGAAVVGNLGSSHIMNYTVIGPSINLAQRLEAKAKAGEIWVHESLERIVDGKVPKPSRKESNVKLKGVAGPITAYVYTDTQF